MGAVIPGAEASAFHALAGLISLFSPAGVRPRVDGSSVGVTALRSGALPVPPKTSTSSGFTAALSRAIETRRAAVQAPTSLAPNTLRVQDRGASHPRASVRPRDVARQLKQLVAVVRNVLSPKVPVAGQALQVSPVPQGDLAAQVADAHALHGVFARLVGINDARQGTTQLSPEAAEEAILLLQAIADALDGAIPGDTVEEALAAALEQDAAALAAAQALVAAAQTQGLIAGGSSAASDSLAAATVGSSTEPAGVAAPASGDVASGPATVAGVATGLTDVASGGDNANEVMLAQISDGDQVPGLIASAVDAETVSSVAAEVQVTANAEQVAQATPAATESGQLTAADPDVAGALSVLSSAVVDAIDADAAGDVATIRAATSDAAGSASVFAAGSSGFDDNLAGGGNGGAQTSEGDAGNVPATFAGTNFTLDPSTGQSVVVAGTPTVVTTVAAETASTAPLSGGQPAGSATVAGVDPAALDLSDADTPAVDLQDQVTRVLVRQARLVRAGEAHEMSLRLEPGRLGPLHVRISLVGGALRVGLTAATSEAQRALELTLPQLRSALLDAGLRLERLDVGLRDAGNGNTNGNANGNAGEQGSGNAYGRTGGEGAPGGPFANPDDVSFADLLLDLNGQPFAVGRAGIALGNASPPATPSPTSVTATDLRPLPGTIAISRGGYGAYGALRVREPRAPQPPPDQSQ
jgi:flagellar hook-length control protein FliK